MPAFTLAIEAWPTIKDEFTALGAAHFDEVDGGVEPRRRYKLDHRLMGLAHSAGILRIMTARAAGRMIGYLAWQLMPDVESEGLSIAMMGPWYVKPGYPRAAFELFRCSVDDLRTQGVQCAFPHHRTQGRGDGLGRFFVKNGARKIQDSYIMWIGAEGVNA